MFYSDTARFCKVVKTQNEGNPVRKLKIMPREMQITKNIMSRIVRKKLRLRALKRRTEFLLTHVLKKGMRE